MTTLTQMERTATSSPPLRIVLSDHQCTSACQQVSGEGVFGGLWVHADARVPAGHVAIDGMLARAQDGEEP